MKSYFFIGFYLCLNSIPRLSFFFSSNPVTISMIAYLYFFFVSFTSTSLPLLSSSSVFMQLFPSLFYLSLLLISLFCNLSYSFLIFFPKLFLSLISGGETEALRRMTEKVSARPAWVCQFQKPDTSPNSLEPSTTVSNALSLFLVKLCYFFLYFFSSPSLRSVLLFVLLFVLLPSHLTLIDLHSISYCFS